MRVSGHEAGDGMLRAVAKELRVRFGAQYAYRVGGDEFIAFVTDGYEAFLTVQSRAMVSSLEDSGYYASAGHGVGRRPGRGRGGACENREGRMYAAKREFYRDPPTTAGQDEENMRQPAGIVRGLFFVIQAFEIRRFPPPRGGRRHGLALLSRSG